MNFLHTFIQAIEQIADGKMPPHEKAPFYTFQIHRDFAPTSSDLVECGHHGVGRYYFVHRKHVGALGALLQDVWQLHRSKFHMGGLLPDASIDWTSLPPCYNVYRPADSAATVAAIAPRATAAASDADSS